MAIRIKQRQVTVTNQSQESVSFVGRKDGGIDTWISKDDVPTISHEDLGLLIQSLKAFHATGSFIVGE